MGLFEFLMVLISVVIGLGLTVVLTGVANLLQARDSVRFHWIHVLLQLGVFFAFLQQWWESWQLNFVGEISFFAVLLLLAPPVLLFLITNLLYPDEPEDYDLQEYYYRQAPLIWGLVVVTTVIGTSASTLVEGNPFFDIANLTGFPTILIGIVLAVSKRKSTHSILVPAALILLVLDTVLANPAISVG